MTMRGVLFGLVCVVVWWGTPLPVLSQNPPPPTPTLAPILGAEPSATQTQQLQIFTRDLYYLLSSTTSYTTTSSNGVTWALERRVSYGDASVVVVLLVIALLQVGTLVYLFTEWRAGR